jgi:alkylation response protein AidB-like acyl-CoA dehydrogenase
MLNFSFSPEQDAFRNKVRSFAYEVLAPNSQKYEDKDELPKDAVKAMSREGLLGLRFPKALGGQSKGYIDVGIAVEELARGDSTCSFLVAGANMWGAGLPWGDEIKRGLIKGEKFMCLGATEPNAGSDASGYTTTALRDGDEYVINGVKRYISFAPSAHVMAVAARTTSQEGARGISLIKVELDRPGIKVSLVPAVGLIAHGQGNIEFNNVRVPVSNLLTEENKAFREMQKIWNQMRIYNTMNPLGAAKASVEESIEYARKRNVYGKPLGKLQSVQFKIVEDYIKIEAALLLCYRGLWKADAGEDIRREAAMAKSFGTEVAFFAIDNAIQNHGAYGYSKATPLERRWRDARAFRIANGAVEVMKSVVGIDLLGDEFASYR